MVSTSNPLALSTGQAPAGTSTSVGRPRLRFTLVGLLLATELCGVAAMGHPWIPVGQSMAGPIVLVAALLFFGRRRLQAARLTSNPLNLRAAGLHALAAAFVVLCGGLMLRGDAVGPAATLVLVTGWLLALAAMLLALPVVLAPVREWVALSRRLGVVWLYALGCAMLAMFARRLELLAWDAPDSRFGRVMADGAFVGVRTVLQRLFQDVSADPARRILGVGSFRIHVAGACSGIEGITLMLFLTLGWMLLERRQLRLLRALWLVPLALTMMWCLNVARMVALITLGAAGQPAMAVKGFHTEAGWITFTLVAVGFLTAANRLPWLRRDHPPAEAGASNPVLVYLLPMVLLLAISLVTNAFSVGFESLYPLRFLVLAVTLLCLWRPLTTMHWRAGWADASAGIAVGLLWISLGRGGDASALSSGLAALPAPARSVWIASRIACSVFLVPLAEELAFRGFLARRLASRQRFEVAEFEHLPYREIGWPGLLASAAAFGAMYGRLWPLGTVAGLVFAGLARRRNSLGAAVLAHATANLVLVAWVLTTGDLSVW